MRAPFFTNENKKPHRNQQQQQLYTLNWEWMWRVLPMSIVFKNGFADRRAKSKGELEI